MDIRGDKRETSGEQTIVHGKPTNKKFMDTAIGRLVPGLSMSLVAAGLAYGMSSFLPAVSPLLVAIILGMLVTNLMRLPANVDPGISFSSKKLLRIGIVLLGLKLALGDIWALDIPTLVVIVAVVTLGIFGTTLMGRMLKVKSQLTTLIACGFSICGAAAVAGAVGVTDPDDEDESSTVSAIALVVIFGTLMIGIMPLLVSVLLMAPVMIVLSLAVRRQKKAEGGSSETEGKLPALVPLFIIGFLAMVLVASFVPLPEVVFSVAGVLQTVCLAAAMFALGCGVKVKALKEVGVRPFALGALATVLVTVIAYVGVVLVSGA